MNYSSWLHVLYSSKCSNGSIFLLDSIRVKIDIGIMLLPVSHDLLPGNRVFQMRDCLKFISDFKLMSLTYSSNQPTPHPM